LIGGYIAAGLGFRDALKMASAALKLVGWICD